MAHPSYDPAGSRITTEGGLGLLTEGGDRLILFSGVEAGGKTSTKTKVEKDRTELWEVGASINRINDDVVLESIIRIRYNIEEDSPTIVVKENFLDHKPSTINVTIRDVRWN